jgi:hypothetical protein
MLTDNDEKFGALLRGADPVRTEALPDPDGPAALRIRTRAHQRSRRTRMRHLVVIPAATALALGGATAGALTLMGDGHASDSLSASCVLPSCHEIEIQGINAVEEDPTERCRELWNYPSLEPGPDQLTACAPRDGQGVVRVYKGSPAVCEEHGEVAYAGPDDEQQRLAQMRTEVRETLGVPERISAGETQEHDCLPREELEARLQELLADYGLTGWTVTHADPEDVDQMWMEPYILGCDSVTYNEQDKQVVIGNPNPEF